jgi:hypothetical protein
VRVLLLVLVAAAMVACSPEATRTRGGGAGADIGNRSSEIELHGRVDPTYGEQLVGQAIRR